jgi:hypothetical protein
MNLSKSRKGDESPYDKKYSMHHHRGNTEDHKRWKREGSSYFKAQTNLMILGLILSNALDVNSIIENWPYKPVEWTPITIGTPTKKDEEIQTLTTLTTPEGSEEAEDAEVPLEALQQEQVDSKVEPTPSQLWDVGDVLYTDTKRVKTIRITVQDLISGNDQLNLFMSATAPSLMPESIAIGTPSDEITAYFVIARLDDKLGMTNSRTETYSLIGQSLTMHFLCGDESATEYLRRMKSKLEPLKSKPNLKQHVDAIIPWVFLNNINKARYKPYDHLAETILLDSTVEAKVEGGYNIFEKYIEKMEATLKCQQKARWHKKSYSNKKPEGFKAIQGRANSAKKKTNRVTANGAQRPLSDCKNCQNEATLLKTHQQKPHTTRDCPFPPTKETIRFFQQKATIIPTGKFADRFASAAGARQESSEMFPITSGEGTGSDSGEDTGSDEEQ